jgi:hypothetical protein
MPSMIELLGDALETEAAHNLLDHIVLGKLKASRDMCVEDRDRLNRRKLDRDLTPREFNDWESLVFDIHALNRVIDYYGG